MRPRLGQSPQLPLQADRLPHSTSVFRLAPLRPPAISFRAPVRPHHSSLCPSHSCLLRKFSTKASHLAVPGHRQPPPGILQRRSLHQKILLASASRFTSDLSSFEEEREEIFGGTLT